MKNIKISTESGAIFLDGNIVAPLSLTDFKVFAKREGIEFSEFNPAVEWTTIGMEVKIKDQEFGMNISYFGNTLRVCWFDWGGGVSSLKGYDTSESELIADKNQLTKIIGDMLCKKPERKNYTNDTFLFGWGYISISASIQSVIVSLSVVWTETCVRSR